MYKFYLDDEHIKYISDPEGIGPTEIGAITTVKFIISDWYQKKYNKKLNIEEKRKKEGLNPFSNLQQTVRAMGLGSEESVDTFNYFLEFETFEEVIFFYKNFSFINLDKYSFIFELHDENYFEIIDWLKENNIKKYAFKDFLGGSCVFLIEKGDAMAFKLKFS